MFALVHLVSYFPLCILQWLAFYLIRHLFGCWRIRAHHPIYEIPLIVPEFHLQEDSYGLPKLVGHLPLLYSKFINQAGGYRLEIPFSYHFYGHEKGVNWLKNRLELIDKDTVKETKHYLNDFNEINWNIFKWNSISFDCT